MAAIEWQTAQDDLEAEKDELEQAMQASLRQEEERKSQQTPLDQQSPEQLLAHFNGSMLLASVNYPARNCFQKHQYRAFSHTELLLDAYVLQLHPCLWC